MWLRRLKQATIISLSISGNIFLLVYIAFFQSNSDYQRWRSSLLNMNSSVPIAKVALIETPRPTEPPNMIVPNFTDTITICEEESSRLFSCDDYTPTTFYGQRGDYWVLYNYIKAAKNLRCDQSLTFTTHGDLTYLENLIPLLERWQGPLSLSLYAPGTDFNETISRIQYLRECRSSLVKDFVTFHIFFDTKHIPKPTVPADPFSQRIDCSMTNPMLTSDKKLKTYRKEKKLNYPVNIARNIARDMATSYYVLPSDLELYPSPNLIRDFLEMIQKNNPILQRPNPRVFVLSAFEISSKAQKLPVNKESLLKMLNNKTAFHFHENVCKECHRVPKKDDWEKDPVKPGLRVFHVAKRMKQYHHWEPFYIGTKFDPLWDERLSWEGRSNKMTQAYILCLKNYDFNILDTAFLVHRPGIAGYKADTIQVYKQNKFIVKTVLPELKQMYGTREGCFMYENDKVPEPAFD